MIIYHGVVGWSRSKLANMRIAMLCLLVQRLLVYLFVQHNVRVGNYHFVSMCRFVIYLV